MAVPVKFTPDMSDVKRAIAEVRSDAARGASFDITAGRSGFASGGNSVPPANSILSGGPGQVPWTGINPTTGGAGGGASFPYGRGFGNVNAGTVANATASGWVGLPNQVLGGSNVPVPAAIAGRGPINMSPGYSPATPYGASLLGGNVPRLIGLGTLANVVSQSLTAERQFNIDTAMAGGDVRGQLDATLQLRERLVQTGGFVGRAVAFLQDPSGADEAAVRATLGSSDAIDARTGRLPGRSLQTALARGRAEVAGTGPGYLRAAASIRTSYATDLMRIDLEAQQNQRKNAEEVTKDVIADVANGKYQQQIIARARQLAPPSGQGAGSSWNDAMEMAEAEIRGGEIRTRTAGRNKADEDATYGPQREFAKKVAEGEMRDLNRERNIQLQLIDRTTKREALVARGLVEAAGRGAIEDEFDLMVAKDPGSADKINLLRADRLRAYNAGTARRRGFAAEDTRDATITNQRMLDRDPLGSRLSRVEHDERVAARDTERTDQQKRDDESFFKSERDRINQDDRDRKRYLHDELVGDIGGLRMALVHQPLAGQAYSQAASTVNKANQLREQEGDPDNARLLLQRGVLSQQVLRQQYFEGFERRSFDPSTTAIDSPRRGEDLSKYLASIDANIRRLLAAQTAGIGVGGATSTD